jgi:cytosol alanyl aminopeptidase
MCRPSLIALLLLCACGSPATKGGSAGPSAPAEAPLVKLVRLPRTFVPSSISARLGIDPGQSGFTGSIEISGQLHQATSQLWLHARGLTVRSAVALQGATRVQLATGTESADLLWLRASTPLPPGLWTLALQYEGAYEEQSTVGAFKQTIDAQSYVTTQFESIFARRVFPCFDEPDVKVSWQLTLDVPIEQLALSNTPVVSETALDAAHKRVVFAPTKPLPSYLIAFGVGPFEVVDAGKTQSGIPLRVIALKGRAADAQWAAQTSATIVNVLEDWVGMPYPYEKLDMLTIPWAWGLVPWRTPASSPTRSA